jgi:hypothetical protein
MKSRKSPRWLRRAPWERGTATLIGLGLVMLMQPWSIEVYSYAFTVLLAGVIGYSIAGKLPTPEAPSAPSTVARGGGSSEPSRPAQAGLEPRLSAPQGGATSGPAKPVPRWPAKEHRHE